MPKARREGTLVFSTDRFPAKGSVTLPTSMFLTTTMYMQQLHGSIIATLVAMLSVSRNIENSRNTKTRQDVNN